MRNSHRLLLSARSRALADSSAPLTAAHSCGGSEPLSCVYRSRDIVFSMRIAPFVVLGAVGITTSDGAAFLGGSSSTINASVSSSAVRHGCHRRSFSRVEQVQTRLLVNTTIRQRPQRRAPLRPAHSHVRPRRLTCRAIHIAWMRAARCLLAMSDLEPMMRASTLQAIRLYLHMFCRRELHTVV